MQNITKLFNTLGIDKGQLEKALKTEVARHPLDMEAIETLLDCPPEIRPSCDALDDALFTATRQGQKSLCLLLMHYGASPAARNALGDTPLLSACRYDECTATAKLLIQEGADVNAKDKHGQTPLMLAVYAGNEELVTALLAHGASIRVANSEGVTALSIAEDRGHEKIAGVLNAILQEFYAPAAVPQKQYRP